MEHHIAAPIMHNKHSHMTVLVWRLLLVRPMLASWPVILWMGRVVDMVLKSLSTMP